MWRNYFLIAAVASVDGSEIPSVWLGFAVIALFVNIVALPMYICGQAGKRSLAKKEAENAQEAKRLQSVFAKLGFHCDKEIAIGTPSHINTAKIHSYMPEVFTYKLFVDDGNKLIVLYKKFDTIRVYNFKDIINFEVVEDGHSIIQGKAMATAVGAAFFGTGGAMIASSGKRQIVGVCSSLILKIFINKLDDAVQIVPILDIPTKKSLPDYTNAKQKAIEIAGVFTYIQNNAGE